MRAVRSSHRQRALGAITAALGFSAAKTGALSMPGPYEPHRLLALELVPGALNGGCGTIAAAGTLFQARRSRRRRAA